ncbi:glycosyltransferase family 4 protein [Streptomyces sp. SID13666]|uniref:glycosyltransferase family 4 protein n=1 Tax=unclassified Streptomyces TaxID=2593676 RepID=UPI0013C07383|nr:MULTISPECIES: glycosyltransferase family 4 protein [unclassified Streptomyces]NEA60176.1 glycosyltransferase family 4 protein [Streptomyces sp. SID13666]NEA74225.1 glycosyltransferase family 4 protein [Streptomyces sp. SID13588]
MTPGSPPRPGPGVATALDLPAGSPGGSVELFLDLYTGPRPLIPARAFMLQPAGPRPQGPAGLELLSVGGKALDGADFTAYVHRLRRALAIALDPDQVQVVHLQHLTFGATPALIRALPHHPRIALVHGTDLLFAAAHRTQLRVLRDTTTAADTIVVPTAAMADHLRQLAPALDTTKLAEIPWGIPDHLITTPPPRPPRDPDTVLRLLYAGRLTSEKGIQNLLRTLTGTAGAELSIAAPAHEFSALAPLLRAAAVPARYLGWLDRRELWRAFADHDALVMPSTILEAMGLVALEAQACGLPVLFQPVPGLNQTLAAGGLPTDFTDSTALATTVRRLRTDSTVLEDLRAAGLANAARFPLSATAAALADLGRTLT